MIQISIKWKLKITPKSVKQGKCLLVATQKRWLHFELLRKSEVTKKMSLKCTLEILLLLCCRYTHNIVLGPLTKLLKQGYYMGII